MPEAKIRGLLFDLDGTLVDSYAAITASVNYVRRLYGKGPLSLEEVKEKVGWGLENLLAKVVPGAPKEEAARAFKAHHAKVMYAKTKLMPGVAETIPVLFRAGLKLGVVSNKPEEFVRALLSHFGLASFFAVMLGPESAPQPKPHPAPLLKALEKMGLSPAEALYVGDMTVDIEAARRAGMRVWVVATGSHTRAALAAANPDRLLNSFSELPRLLGISEGPL